MKRRLLISLAPLLAVAVLAVGPALAQAAPPMWFSNAKLIPAGEVVPVQTTGALTFKVPATKTTIKCNLADLEQIENTAAGGVDRIVRFALSGCASKVPLCPTGAQAEVEALLNPFWPTRLLEGPPIRDEIASMLFVVRCGSTVIDTYTGTLDPEVGNSVLKFNSTSGTLINGGGFPVKVTGTDKLKGPPGDLKITAA